MAKITFKKIEYQNFLSAGDKPITIELDKVKTTLVIGTNGAGKSTGLLDGISYALFGKAHRKINKPQLINSVNGKNMRVTLWFEIGRVKYKIVRGMRTKVFEIWQNGRMLNQEAHDLDYQKILESNIIKMSHKAFHQIVVLGNSNFTPFMQLTAQSRRSVIEDLLDIHVFSRMSHIIKGRISNLKAELLDISNRIRSTSEKIKLSTKHIAELKEIDSAYAKQIEDEIKEFTFQMEELNKKNLELFEEIDDIRTTDKLLEEINEKMLKTSHEYSSHDAEGDKIQDEIDFYQEHDTCPTCNQDIHEEYKSKTVSSLSEKREEKVKHLSKIEKQLDGIRERQTLIKKDLKKVSSLNSDITGNNAAVSTLMNNIQAAKEKLNRKSTVDTTKAEEALTELYNTLNQTRKQEKQYKKVFQYCSFIEEILRDNGIKSKVIKQYLPVMNKLINQYLQVLDFFVSFHIDEEFNETIKSRHRDIFSYSSFSEGERTRIDLALIFTWRQIAKMKNSISTNLLVMDEICDSSLDAVGVENLIKIIDASDKNNSVFIISHKTELTEESSRFDRTLEFKKEGNFSKMSEH